MNYFKYKPKHVVEKKEIHVNSSCAGAKTIPERASVNDVRAITFYHPHFDLFGEFMNGSWYPKGSICHLMYSFYRPPRPFPQKQLRRKFAA